MHPSINSVAVCESCGKGVCGACLVEMDDHIYCRACVCKLLKKAKREREAAQEIEMKKRARQAAALPVSTAWVGPEPGVKYPQSVCCRHPKVASIAICESCGNGVCAACLVEADDGMLCRPCAVASIKKAEPVAVAPAVSTPAGPAISIAALGTIAASQPKAKEEPGSRAPEDIDGPSQPLSIAALGAIAAAQAATMNVVKGKPAAEPPVPPEVERMNQVAELSIYEERPPGSYEPKIPLVLSVIVPGYGQIYNGHWRKGLALLSVEVAIWIMVAALLLQYVSWNLWAVLLVALVLILYSGYDAYQSALKIKNGQTVVDWFS